jgi:N-acetylmuramoyl-L-alanine amidase
MSKWTLLLAVACLELVLFPLRAAVFNGQEYISVKDWAKMDGMTYFWIKAGDLFEVKNDENKLIFDVDSHYAEINGVQVALSFPIAKQKNDALIAKFDLEKTIRPLLFPARYVKRQTIKTICLDPGHGGKDSGNRVGWHKEKMYTLYLAFDLRNVLKKDGFNVIMTRTKDVYVDLPARPAYANEHHADLFVSLHFNATATARDTVKGPESYCITPVGASSTNSKGEGSDYGKTTGNEDENNSLLLAYQVEKSLVQGLNLDDRGVRRARFAVLRGAEMPAILVESGYMSNPEEGEKIYTPAYRHELARAIANGILAYQKEVEKH